MPTESGRLQRRISRRDQWFLGLIASAALIGTPSAILVFRGSSHPRTDPHCVTMLRASIMGGATYKYCGTNAIAACEQFAAHDTSLAVQCEKRGLFRAP